MNREARAQVIRGLVHSGGHWMPIGKKIELENERRKKIAAGLVEYQGGWVTIDQKMTLLGLNPLPAPAPAGPHIVINQTFNIRESHKHLHVQGNPQEGTAIEPPQRGRLGNPVRQSLSAPDFKALPPAPDTNP